MIGLLKFVTYYIRVLRYDLPFILRSKPVLVDLTEDTPENTPNKELQHEEEVLNVIDDLKQRTHSTPREAIGKRVPFADISNISDCSPDVYSPDIDVITFKQLLKCNSNQPAKCNTPILIEESQSEIESPIFSNRSQNSQKSIDILSQKSTSCILGKTLNTSCAQLILRRRRTCLVSNNKRIRKNIQVNGLSHQFSSCLSPDVLISPVTSDEASIDLFSPQPASQISNLVDSRQQMLSFNTPKVNQRSKSDSAVVTRSCTCGCSKLSQSETDFTSPAKRSQLSFKVIFLSGLNLIIPICLIQSV